jgi:hypothetical protein
MDQARAGDHQMNVIAAEFHPDFFEHLFRSIKYYGVKRTEKAYLDANFHPSFVTAAIRRILRKGDW